MWDWGHIRYLCHGGIPRSSVLTRSLPNNTPGAKRLAELKETIRRVDRTFIGRIQLNAADDNGLRLLALRISPCNILGGYCADS